MTYLSLLPPIFGVIGLAAAYVVYGLVMRYTEGTDAVKKIGDAIHTGAMVFMHREYTMLGIFAAVLLVLILISPLGIGTASPFMAGAVSTAIAGWIGIYTATKAND